MLTEPAGRANKNDWLVWAMTEARLHPHVIGFVMAFPHAWERVPPAAWDRASHVLAKLKEPTEARTILLRDVIPDEDIADLFIAMLEAGKTFDEHAEALNA